MPMRQKTSDRLRTLEASGPPKKSRKATARSQERRIGKRATASKPTARNIGDAFAALVRDERDVNRLWVQDSLDHVDLWLLTEPLSYARRLQLRELKPRLRAQFPKAAITLHIENAALYTVEPEQFQFDPPYGALSVTLR